MHRFVQVRLRNGIGVVNLRAASVAPPPDGAEFRVASVADDHPVPFYVVEAQLSVAVVSPGERVAPEEQIAGMLLRVGFPVVVFIHAEGSGSADARCYSDAEDAIEHAACGIWGLKALGGWDESPLMTFRVEHVTKHEVRETTARPSFADGAWSLDVD